MRKKSKIFIGYCEPVESFAFQKDEIAYDIEKIDYKNVNRRIEELRAFH